MHKYINIFIFIFVVTDLNSALLTSSQDDEIEVDDNLLNSTSKNIYQYTDKYDTNTVTDIVSCMDIVYNSSNSPYGARPAMYSYLNSRLNDPDFSLAAVVALAEKGGVILVKSELIKVIADQIYESGDASLIPWISEVLQSNFKNDVVNLYKEKYEEEIFGFYDLTIKRGRFKLESAFNLNMLVNDSRFEDMGPFSLTIKESSPITLNESDCCYLKRLMEKGLSEIKIESDFIKEKNIDRLKRIANQYNVDICLDDLKRSKLSTIKEAVLRLDQPQIFRFWYESSYRNMFQPNPIHEVPVLMGIHDEQSDKLVVGISRDFYRKVEEFFTTIIKRKEIITSYLEFFDEHGWSKEVRKGYKPIYLNHLKMLDRIHGFYNKIIDMERREIEENKINRSERLKFVQAFRLLMEDFDMIGSFSNFDAYLQEVNNRPSIEDNELLMMALGQPSIESATGILRIGHMIRNNQEQLDFGSLMDVLARLEDEMDSLDEDSTSLVPLELRRAA